MISENSRCSFVIVTGREATPRSWLYEHQTDAEIQSRWLAKLSILDSDRDPERLIYTDDTGQLAKWGQMGEIAPISTLDDLLIAGFSDDRPPLPSAFSTPEWRDAKTKAVAYLKARGLVNLRPKSYGKVVEDMRTRGTLESNSGWPDFTRRSSPVVENQAIADAYNGNWRYFPAIALFRNYYNKTRLVWMFPMSANVVEGSYTQPLLAALVKAAKKEPTSFFVPWLGFTAVKKAISLVYSNTFLSASDFSATDAHFTLASSMEVYSILEEVFQASARKGLLESIENLHLIPLIFSVNEAVTGYHGVASGSNWTNMIETLFDLIFGFFVEAQTGVKGFYAIGDDMTWINDEHRPSFASELEALGLSVGQVIRADKTTNEKDKVKTLQRTFYRGYKDTADGFLRGIYPTIRALNSSVFPERFHSPKLWSSDMFCSRQFMILENCVDHPLFEDFVKFVSNGQKDLIPFAKLKREELDRIRRETRLLPGLNPVYNQEKLGYSFADFASIRIASRM